jgi:hypothetical protein
MSCSRPAGELSEADDVWPGGCQNRQAPWWRTCESRDSPAESRAGVRWPVEACDVSFDEAAPASDGGDEDGEVDVAADGGYGALLEEEIVSVSAFSFEAQ